jgi:hypothetical protein
VCDTFIYNVKAQAEEVQATANLVLLAATLKEF